MSLFLFIFFPIIHNCPFSKVWSKNNKESTLLRERELWEAQIIDTGDDIKSKMEFFSEISVSGAQNFEFFELDKNMLDKNSFWREMHYDFFAL